MGIGTGIILGSLAGLALNHVVCPSSGRGGTLQAIVQGSHEGVNYLLGAIKKGTIGVFVGIVGSAIIGMNADLQACEVSDTAQKCGSEQTLALDKSPLDFTHTLKTLTTALKPPVVEEVAEEQSVRR